MNTLIHVTHEAHEKMGGIGAVLEGLLTTRAYQSVVDRTILVGSADIPLAKPPENLQAVHYETGRTESETAPLEPALVEAFNRIEATYGVRLLYGRRAVPCPLETRRASAELLLFDVRHARPEPVNQLKADLWKAYGVESDRFERDWGYEEWVRDLIEQDMRQRLIFDQALETRLGLDSYEAHLREIGGYKYALVSRSCHSHRIFAVSDRVAEELRLLASDFTRAAIDVVYNGLPVRPITLAARMKSRALLRQYVQAVVGFRPDFVFTHVARPVASKAIERDLAVLEHLDDILADRGQTAVLLVLATDGGRRDLQLVQQMAAEYGWPLGHRIGWPDLVKGETPIGLAAEQYNSWARATRAVLINQFGLSRETCGDRVPEGFTLQDLRQGSDVEFGQSAYEPFGIAQLETLAFGGISVISCVCGCAQLLTRVAGDALPPNVLLARYSAAPGSAPATESETRRVEHEVAAGLARELAGRLPTDTDQFARLLESGWALAEKMSWQAVCRDYFIPALERCLGRACRRGDPERHAREARRQPARAR